MLVFVNLEKKNAPSILKEASSFSFFKGGEEEASFKSTKLTKTDAKKASFPFETERRLSLFFFCQFSPRKGSPRF